MAAMHGPHQVAQNSRTTTLPLSASQAGRASDGACNSFSNPIGGGLPPTLISLVSAPLTRQTTRATAQQEKKIAFFMRHVLQTPAQSKWYLIHISSKWVCAPRQQARDGHAR